MNEYVDTCVNIQYPYYFIGSKTRDQQGNLTFIDDYYTIAQTLAPSYAG